MAGATVLGRLSWQLAEVVESFDETPRTKTLVLAVPEWEGHAPGQHVDVRLTAEDGYQAQRSYSIGSAPDRERVELTIERLEDGEVSTYLADVLRAGDRFELRGPIGGYFTWTANHGGPLFLIAGGSGIVPLMSMIRYRARIGVNVPVRLLYSSRSDEEIIFRDELYQLAESEANFEVFHTLTRAQPDGWSGFQRRIDREILAEVGWRADERPLVYVCGPTGLVESVSSMLVSLGHEPSQIRTERFGPTGG
jgi:ferredoxin-NADP reductase